MQPLSSEEINQAVREARPVFGEVEGPLSDLFAWFGEWIKERNERLRIETENAFPVIVRKLMDLVGTKEVAYIAGVASTSSVRRWAQGRCLPHSMTRVRVKAALETAQLLFTPDHPDRPRIFLRTFCPLLSGQLPDELLRIGTSQEREAVIQAAREYARGIAA